MPDLEQAIRERAYQLWIEGGRQDGNAETYWLAAQREILVASLSTFARVSVTDQPKATKAKRTSASKRKRRAA
jgi:Protein of unknown function (DUF2934)